ncbi:nucleotidyltransferase [archaeon]|nr:nucleotidyltransferase [archaeon]MBT4351986.1 nucleotidyltransferase [archaeon]MBT4647733.1 nucleotidyltransferase [archaeon]MBT6821261.1 nucleotidyltransferase [archaeon]MBT7392062.1 nucleotidyltransferase [archaeon]
MGLFGSYIKNKQKKDSDLDFIDTFEKNTFDNYMDLKFLLEKLFNKNVDLIIEKSLKPRLKYVKKETIYLKRL